MRVRLGLITALSLPLLFACAVTTPCFADAGADLKAGQALMSAGKYDDAIVLFRSVVSSGDAATAPKAQLCIGIALQGKKAYLESISALKDGIQTYPNAERVRSEMLFRLGEVYGIADDTASAIAVFQSIAVQYPADAAKADLRLARTYLGLKRNAEATDVLKTSIAAHPDAGNTLIELKSLLGQSYKASGDLKNATTTFQTLMTQYPAKADQFGCGLGECLLAAGHDYESKKQYDQAIEQYNRVRTVCPSLADKAYLAEGVSLQFQGKFGEAQAAYQKAVEMGNGASNEARLRIDEVLRAEKDYAGELAYLRKLSEEIPDLRAASLVRQAEVKSECLGGVSEAKGAIDILRQVMSEFPDDPLAIEAQARIAAIQVHHLRELATAEAALRDFMAKHPDYPALIVVAHDLAFCSYFRQNYAAAAPLFAAAAKLKDVGNYVPVCIYMAADCYMRTGDFANAKTNADLLIATYPDESWADVAKVEYFNLTGRGRTGGVK